MAAFSSLVSSPANKHKDFRAKLGVLVDTGGHAGLFSARPNLRRREHPRELPDLCTLTLIQAWQPLYKLLAP